MGNNIVTEPIVYKNKIIIGLSNFHASIFDSLNDDQMTTLKTNFDGWCTGVPKDAIYVIGDDEIHTRVAKLLGISVCQYRYGIDILDNSILYVPANTLNTRDRNDYLGTRS